MSSKRLVVLEETDYQKLLHRDKPVETKDTQTEKLPDGDLPAPNGEPDEPGEPNGEPNGEPEEPEDPNGEPNGEQVSSVDFLSSVPKVAQQEAQNLLARLGKLSSFNFDPESGEIKIDGKILNNYNVQKFLTTTCSKSARDDIPVPLRLFLRKHDIRLFRNKKIRLPRAEKWKSQFD